MFLVAGATGLSYYLPAGYALLRSRLQQVPRVPFLDLRLPFIGISGSSLDFTAFS